MNILIKNFMDKSSDIEIENNLIVEGSDVDFNDIVQPRLLRCILNEEIEIIELLVIKHGSYKATCAIEPLINRLNDEHTQFYITEESELLAHCGEYYCLFVSSYIGRLMDLYTELLKSKLVSKKYKVETQSLFSLMRIKVSR